MIKIFQICFLKSMNVQRWMAFQKLGHIFVYVCVIAYIRMTENKI